MNNKKKTGFVLIGISIVGLIVYLFQRQAAAAETEKSEAIRNAVGADRIKQANAGKGVGKFGTKPKFGEILEA